MHSASMLLDDVGMGDHIEVRKIMLSRISSCQKNALLTLKGGVNLGYLGKTFIFISPHAPYDSLNGMLVIGAPARVRFDCISQFHFINHLRRAIGQA